jgi:hypothetical protein
MKFDYKHTLSNDDAKTRLEALGEYLTNRHRINVTWDGGRGTVLGKYLLVHIEGVMTFGDGTVHFVGKDPGILWRKKAVNYLKKKLGMYLDPDTPLEELPRA